VSWVARRLIQRDHHAKESSASYVPEVSQTHAVPAP
jgi:hypothetical protein